ncbi:MAG: hypothetical protein WDW38_008769 [Sanguina aurantia]
MGWEGGKRRMSLKPLQDKLSFDKGFYVFVRALQMLKASNEGTILVGLAGPSGAGKTAFSEKMKSFMPGIAVISMDNYNDGSKVVDDNFDDPRLTDYDTLLQNLAEISAGQTAQIPIYDYQLSKRTGVTPLKPPPGRVVIIEGIYALSDRLRPWLHLRVSITGGVHFDLVKRVMRDISRSGQGPEEILQQVRIDTPLWLGPVPGGVAPTSRMAVCVSVASMAVAVGRSNSTSSLPAGLYVQAQGRSPSRF